MYLYSNEEINKECSQLLDFRNSINVNLKDDERNMSLHILEYNICEDIFPTFISFYRIYKYCFKKYK